LLPKLAGDFDWINAGLLPPSLLVADTVNCAVVGTAQRDREFIARLAAKRARLHNCLREITKIEKQPQAKYKDAGIAEPNAAIGELNLRKFIVVLGRE
jgi:hypothetical protein